MRKRHHQEWDKVVRKISGGLTILSVAKGQWTNPATNQVIAERMIPVRIACTEAQIRRIINFTLTHYNQDAVLAYEVSQKVIYVAKDSR